MAAEIPKNILDALFKAFKAESEADSVGRVVFFLSESISKQHDEPFIRALSSTLSHPAVFKSVAQQIVEDTKTAEKDPQYKQMMIDVWNNFLKENTNPGDSGQRLDKALVPQSPQNHKAVAQYVFMRAVSRLGPHEFGALKNAVSRFGGSVAVYGGKALAAVRKAGTVVRVVLLTVTLANDVIKNINRWWKGEISGSRCVKNVIDCGVGVAAGLAGGYVGEITGAALLAPFGPVGVAIGAIGGALFGGVAASWSAEKLSDRLTQWTFGLPKSEALENAYSFLDVDAVSTNSAINSKYRQLALQYHPDKGGDGEKWTQLQYSMAIIREARDEI